MPPRSRLPWLAAGAGLLVGAGLLLASRHEFGTAMYVPDGEGASGAEAPDGAGLAGGGLARPSRGTAPEPVRATPGAVAVRLLDEGGRGFGAASVSIDAQVGAEARADEDGVFRRDGLAPGPHVAWVRSAVCATTSAPFEAVSGRTAEVTIPVHVGVRVSGVVTDPKGAPVPGATVRVAVPDPSGAGSRVVATVTADAEGRYDVGNLPDGPLRLHAVGDGFDSLDAVTEVSGAATGLAVRGVWLGRARLRLVADDGAPLPETAEVNVGVPGEEDPYEDTVPIRDGVIVVPGFVGGDEQLVVDVAGYAAVVRTASIPPGSEQDLGTAVLDAGIEFAGTVVDVAGAPVAKALVTAAGDRARGWTEGDGTFRLPHLPAGDVDVAVRAEGYLPLEPTEVLLGRAKKTWRFVLRKAAVVEGVLRRADGAAAAGERLVVTALDDAVGPQVPAEHRAFRTEEDGTFRAELPPGPYRIEAREGEAAVLLTEVTLADGERRALVLALPRR